MIIKIQVCWHASNRLQNSMHCLLSPQCCLKDNRKRWCDYRRHISFVYMYFLISPHGAHITCVILCLKRAAWVHAVHVRPLVRVTPLGHAKTWLYFWRCTTQGNSQSPLTAVRFTSFSYWWSLLFSRQLIYRKDRRRSLSHPAPHCLQEQNDPEGTRASCIVWSPSCKLLAI